MNATPMSSESRKTTFARRRLIALGLTAVVILGASGVAAYFVLTHNDVYIDQATIAAPLITLSPTSAGKLQALYVHVGDSIPAYTPVAQVGNQIIESKVAGTVVDTSNTIGALVSPSTSVVTMVDPSQLRVVGKLDENKGLAQVRVGDPVTFTVDAFGGKEFSGVVDEVSPTAVATGIVFDISSQRPTQQFYVKARFDTSAYPELKNGMSARMWVHTGS